MSALKPFACAIQIEGVARHVADKIQNAVGGLSGDIRTQAEGQVADKVRAGMERLLTKRACCREGPQSRGSGRLRPCWPLATNLRFMLIERPR
jgi:hypothetical protein